MTTNQTPIRRCQYCKSDDLGLGWQHGEALVTYKKHGLLGSRLRYLVCRRCGGRGVSVGGGTSQVSAYQVSYPEIVP